MQRPFWLDKLALAAEATSVGRPELLAVVVVTVRVMFDPSTRSVVSI